MMYLSATRLLRTFSCKRWYTAAESVINKVFVVTLLGFVPCDYALFVYVRLKMSECAGGDILVLSIMLNCLVQGAAIFVTLYIGMHYVFLTNHMWKLRYAYTQIGICLWTLLTLAVNQVAYHNDCVIATASFDVETINHDYYDEIVTETIYLYYEPVIVINQFCLAVHLLKGIINITKIIVH